MLTLADFLLARIAEDEKLAREAYEENPAATWETNRTYDGVYRLELPSTHPDSDSYGMGEDIRLPREMAKHIARHHPTRVLAECEAKRQIAHNVAAWTAAKEYAPGDNIVAIERELVRVLRYLALPYADHPDYREEWRP